MALSAKLGTYTKNIENTLHLNVSAKISHSSLDEIMGEIFREGLKFLRKDTI